MNEATRIYRPHAGDGGRLGEILESGGEPGHERLRVRWEDGRESVLYPGGDVRIRPKHRARRTSRRRP